MTAKSNKKYSVSLVFQKTTFGNIASDLRVTHVVAATEEEALGIAIERIWADEALKDFTLGLKVVLEFTE